MTVFVDIVMGGPVVKTTRKSDTGIQATVIGIAAGAGICGKEREKVLIAAFLACARQCPAQEGVVGDVRSALSAGVAQSAQWTEDISVTGVMAISS